MADIDLKKVEAFRKQFNDVIGQAIVDGLLDPTQAPDVPGVGIHGKGGNYFQTGGDYTQSTGGEHRQSGGGGYAQSIEKFE